MQQKLQAIPLPDIKDKKVLDIGCDMGFWSFLCSQRGASYVLGLDRSRPVRGEYLDLVDYNLKAAHHFEQHSNCDFHKINLGRQWHQFGKFDVSLMFSLYHHVYAQCWSHQSIWYWLWQHTQEELLWENPLTTQDRVVQMNVHHTDNYNQKEIFKAADRFFNHEYIGPAVHEPHRFVFRFRPKELKRKTFTAKRKSGAGGASKAWKHNDDKRMKEFAYAIGEEVHYGSINMQLEEPFPFGRCYYRFPMSDVADRNRGLDSAWKDRWVRVYPVKVQGQRAYVFRFEGERYPSNFIEVISPVWIEDEVLEVEIDEYQ